MAGFCFCWFFLFFFWILFSLHIKITFDCTLKTTCNKHTESVVESKRRYARNTRRCLGLCSICRQHWPCLYSRYNYIQTTLSVFTMCARLDSSADTHEVTWIGSKLKRFQFYTFRSNVKSTCVKYSSHSYKILGVII